MEKCKTCKKDIVPGVAYYDLWRLSMPAHPIGYMCKECNDKRFIVQAKVWVKRLYGRFWREKHE